MKDHIRILIRVDSQISSNRKKINSTFVTKMPTLNTLLCEFQSRNKKIFNLFTNFIRTSIYLITFSSRYGKSIQIGISSLFGILNRVGYFFLSIFRLLSELATEL
jgi:hypothetical protein